MLKDDIHPTRSELLSSDIAFPDSDAPSYAPGTKYWRRVKLLENGELLAIYEGNDLVKIDRDSRLIWAYAGWAHHDLEVMADGTIYVLTRQAEILPRLHPEKPVLHDFIVVLDADGNELRKISIIEAIENSEYADLFVRMPKAGDVLHTNTLEVLDGALAERAFLSAWQRAHLLAWHQHDRSRRLGRRESGVGNEWTVASAA